MLESLKFRAIHIRCFFSVEHTFHHCFDKFTGDVIGELSPNVVARELFYPLLVSFLFLVAYWVNLNQYGKYFRPPASLAVHLGEKRYLRLIWRNIKNVVPRTRGVSEHLLQVRD